MELDLNRIIDQVVKDKGIRREVVIDTLEKALRMGPFEPKRAIYDAAAEIAAELDLPEGWLNDAIKGFLSGPDEGATPVLELPGLRVATASPRILLAMKVLAHRAGEDDDDVRLLAGQLGLTTAAAVLSVATEVYGDRLDAAARFFVEEVFAVT